MNKLIGKTYGDLKVEKIHYENEKLNYRKYLCKCECGEEIIVDEIDLLSGKVLNCGCKCIKEFFTLNCECCNKNITIEFDKNKLKKIEKESFIDKNGKQHYSIFYELNYLCDKCKFDRVIKNDDLLSSENVRLLKKFINENCVLSDYFPAKKRTSRKDFKFAYNNWLGKNNSFDKRLNNNSFNLALAKLYSETFIKSNGVIYLTKIKLKD